MDNEEVINTEIDTVPVKRRLGFVSGVSIIVGSIIGKYVRLILKTFITEIFM